MSITTSGFDVTFNNAVQLTGFYNYIDTTTGNLNYQNLFTPIQGVHFKLIQSGQNNDLVTLYLYPNTSQVTNFLPQNNTICCIYYYLIPVSNFLKIDPNYNYAPAYYCFVASGNPYTPSTPTGAGGQVSYVLPNNMRTDTNLNPLNFSNNNTYAIAFGVYDVPPADVYNIQPANGNVNIGAAIATKGGNPGSAVLFPYSTLTYNNETITFGNNTSYATPGGGTGSTLDLNSYNGNGGNIGGFAPSPGLAIIQWFWPEPITSDICFPAGTPVKTDQGLLSIEKIRPGINTIHRNRIETITKTITNDNYLVCFEKDSLDINLPIRRTLISKNHKILYKNKLIEAHKFIHAFHGVHKVEYTGEILYNVLMDDYYTMDVNNLICETLHPKNVIAQIHNSSYSAEDKKKIYSNLSRVIKNKDTTTYKKMAMTLTSKKVD
jgi:hypothetical protein